MEQIYLGSFGIPLDAYAKHPVTGVTLDVSAASTKMMEIIDASGNQTEEVASFITDGTDGGFTFLTTDGFIDEAGLWRYRYYYTLGSVGKYYTDWIEFLVLRNKGGL